MGDALSVPFIVSWFGVMELKMWWPHTCVLSYCRRHNLWHRQDDKSLEKKYPSIDFSCLPSTVWWYVDQKLKDQLTDPRKCYEWVLQNGNCGLGETDCHFHRRIEEFHEFLQSRCESNIIVFTHGAFMRGFFHKYCNRPFRQIVRNVEIITYTL